MGVTLCSFVYRHRRFGGIHCYHLQGIYSKPLREKKINTKKIQFQQLTCSDNKVRELITVEVLYTSLLNTTVVSFKVLPLRSYAPMPVPSPNFKTILEMVLWKGLQSCRCMTPDDINVIKMPSCQYILHLREQQKITGD